MPLNFILRLLFPPHCVGCAKYLSGEGVLCETCRSSIKIDDVLRCGRCGARLPDGKKICHFDVPYVLGAAMDYRSPVVRELIRSLKFNGVRGAADIFSGLLNDYALRVSPKLPSAEDAVVVPIPLGKQRLRERGFNQAELIASGFAKHYGCRVADVLERQRETKPQSEITDHTDRENNVRDCFVVKPGNSFSGVRVILVDDVSTSGATLTAAAHALVAAGARKIIALTAARAR
jgi:ComF family protein